MIVDENDCGIKEKVCLCWVSLKVYLKYNVGHGKRIKRNVRQYGHVSF